MYKSFYRLERKPFEIIPDTSFLWLGENHQEALSTLRYGILDNKGFLLLTGDFGVGKTLIISALTKSLDSDIEWGVIDDPTLERLDFYNEIARKLGIDKKFTSKVQFLIQFSHFLYKTADDNKKVLLLIDQCHLLSQEMLEELRLLSNIEKADAKLINIFFVGEGSFTELLRQPKNRAVRQRLTLTAEIPKLSVLETEDYIKHRLEAAGAEGKIFSAKACQVVYRYSMGVPLEINKICDVALKFGASQEAPTITPALIEDALDRADLAKGTIAIPAKNIEPVFEPRAQKDYSQFKVGESPDSKITGFNVEVDRKTGWLKYGFAAIILVMMGGYFYKSYRPPVAQVGLGPEVVQQVVAEPPGELAAEVTSPAGVEENTGEIKKVNIEELKSVILEKAYEIESSAEKTAVVESEESSREVAVVPEVVDKKNKAPVVSAPVATAPVVPEPVVTAPVVSEPVVSGPIESEHKVSQEPVVAEVQLGEDAPTSVADVEVEDISTPEPEAQMAPLEPRKVMLPLQPNSLKLTKSGRKRFYSFVEKLLNYPKATVLVKGYVSSKTNSPENIKLSEDRALEVYKMLLKEGVDPEQIEIEGMGIMNPIASNDTRAGRAKNRRVEILVIQDGLE